MKDMIEMIVMQSKRREQLALVENIFSATRCPPKVCEQGGIHVLPGLTLRPRLGTKAPPGPRRIEPSNTKELGMRSGGGGGGGDQLSGPRTGPPVTGAGSMGGRGAGTGSMGGRGAGTGYGPGPIRGPSTAGTGMTSSSQMTAGASGLHNTSAPRSGAGPPILLKYPSNTPLPRATVPALSVTLMALYGGKGSSDDKGWARAMWRHAIALVLCDIRYASTHSTVFNVALLLRTMSCSTVHCNVQCITATSGDNINNSSHSLVDLTNFNHPSPIPCLSRVCGHAFILFGCIVPLL